jgi:hypothetical protein
MPADAVDYPANPYAPLSSNKKASIIKVEHPGLSVQHSVHISNHPPPSTPSTTSTTHMYR